MFHYSCVSLSLIQILFILFHTLICTLIIYKPIDMQSYADQKVNVFSFFLIKK